MRKMILSVHRNQKGRLQHIHILWMWEWVLQEVSVLTLTDVGWCRHSSRSTRAIYYNHLSSFTVDLLFLKHTRPVWSPLRLQRKGGAGFDGLSEKESVGSRGVQSMPNPLAYVMAFSSLSLSFSLVLYSGSSSTLKQV